VRYQRHVRKVPISEVASLAESRLLVEFQIASVCEKNRKVCGRCCVNRCGSFTLSSAGRANNVGIWAHLGLFKQCRSITSITQWGRIAENGQVVSTVNDWGHLCRMIESQRASAPTMPGTADRADRRSLRTHAPYNLSGHLRPNSPPIMPPIRPLAFTSRKRRDPASRTVRRTASSARGPAAR
jgi:hypothetical protein